MRVLVGFDKFKDSLSAPQACQAAAGALRRRHPDWRIDLCPLTDGGDGFAALLTEAAGGRLVTVPVTGPRGGLVEAGLGLVAEAQIPAAARRLLSSPGATPARSVAVLEMAAASGLALLPPALRDPWQTSTYGTGQLIRAAAELGAAAILLGVGGSATNDLGLGALAALGLEFRGAGGGLVRPPVPAAWAGIGRVDGGTFAAIPPIHIACDVTNPLLGPQGAAAIYGPQKGLQPADLARLEEAAERMAGLLCAHCGQPRACADVPGAGAAGGLPFGLVVGARARLVPGFALVAAWLDLEARIAAADLVITGEGRFDPSSLAGKGPGTVAAAASRAGKPVHVFAGAIRDAPARPGWQLHAVTPPDYPWEQAQREAAALLARSVEAAL
ncbi:MAG TPA: glycerate kinase [Opitutaceae bacterium]|nr:glycerate kinase [Opitutaceae bacterium]